MSDSIMSHMSIGTNQFAAAVAFYETVLATLGCRKLVEHPGAVAFGRRFPEFWVQTPFDARPATVGNGVHFGFLADSRAQVHAFHAAALAAGGRDDGAPGPRPLYGEPYYGCFVRDLDGHKIEAALWDEEVARKLGM
jgi:catechol 2,3-dioxygenase-like lactoylglutathione lyase family enzyme